MIREIHKIRAEGTAYRITQDYCLDKPAPVPVEDIAMDRGVAIHAESGIVAPWTNPRGRGSPRPGCMQRPSNALAPAPKPVTSATTGESNTLAEAPTAPKNPAITASTAFIPASSAAIAAAMASGWLAAQARVGLTAPRPRPPGWRWLAAPS